MAHDLFFRAINTATYIKWLTRPQVRAIIGDLRARDKDGSVSSPTALRGIPGAVDLIQWDVNQITEVRAIYDTNEIDRIIITPAVMDPQAWIHVRLTGPSEVADFTGPPIDTEVELDRWEHSKLINLMKSAGNPDVHRGVSIIDITTGPNKGISVFRGFELETIIAFHEFEGGNSY